MPRNPNDPFTTYRTDLDSPAQYAVAITPNNDVVLDTSIRALYVGNTSTVNIYCRPVGISNTDSPAANILFQHVVGGTVLPIRLEAVWHSNVYNLSQNTTTGDGDLIGLY
jgi:hypothetical protein